MCSLVIKYLRDDLVTSIERRTVEPITDSDIHWVLTVPDIRSYAAETFLKEAAEAVSLMTLGTKQIRKLS